jgi:hypothetical protein
MMQTEGSMRLTNLLKTRFQSPPKHINPDRKKEKKKKRKKTLQSSISYVKTNSEWMGKSGPKTPEILLSTFQIARGDRECLKREGQGNANFRST